MKRQLALKFTQVVLLLYATSATSEVPFTTITSSDLLGHLPGPDGLVGTQDDLLRVAANPTGTATYALFSGTPFSPAEDVVYSLDGTLTVNEGFVSIDGQTLLTDFLIRLTSNPTSGFASNVFDLPVSPHRIETAISWSQTVEYTQGVCFIATGCSMDDPVLDLEVDLGLSGFLLPRGLDPSLVPGIDPVVASYLNRLISLAPQNWTAISFSMAGPVLLTSSNTRGRFDAQFIGGSVQGVTAFVTTAPLTITISAGPLDSDSDGIPDRSDNCRTIPNAGAIPPGHLGTGNQTDDDLDGVGNACDADFTEGGGDGFVNVTDLLHFLDAFGKQLTETDCPAQDGSPTGLCSRYDLTAEGDVINVSDLLVMISDKVFGKSVAELGCAPDDSGTVQCPLQCGAGAGAACP
jgi:hypothetical protein